MSLVSSKAEFASVLLCFLHGVYISLFKKHKRFLSLYGKRQALALSSNLIYTAQYMEIR
jgi:hypothetical protein